MARPSFTEKADNIILREDIKRSLQQWFEAMEEKVSGIKINTAEIQAQLEVLNERTERSEKFIDAFCARFRLLCRLFGM